MEKESHPASEGFPAGEVLGLEAFARHVFFLVRAVLFLHPFRHLGNGFAVVNLVTFSSGHSSIQLENFPLTIRRFRSLPTLKMNRNRFALFVVATGAIIIAIGLVFAAMISMFLAAVAQFACAM